MGCRELIESLRQAGDERVRQIRAGAEQEAERIRADSAERIAKAREAKERQHAAEAARFVDAAMARANAEARRIKIRAERALANRLLAVARSSLRSLRNVGYNDLFAGLVRELPRAAWKNVQVNSEDVPLARKFFPDAEITADRSITGGFAALSEGGKVRVVNTFEKRLERLWEEMLPDMIAEATEREG